ncbi:hypothetical protein V5T82_13765 [Magnetovibrio sp. PR-2]|uniref:hypothetical protein n=1 Tax=Magnetovibrio sp. PR-2 TaxID=3120356 RepID=UPI002FCE68FA
MAKKRPYQRPEIKRLTPRHMGKHRVTDVALSSKWPDENIDYKALMAEFGSPLFLLSEQKLRQQYQSFMETFTAPGIDTVVGYSYKTNYLKAVCAIMHDEGAWAEVVSGMEYALARSLGVPGEKIIFNGPYKSRDELERAVQDGALINVDGFDELNALISVAKAVGKKARLGLRINFKYGAQPWTKFGFSSDTGQVRAALKDVKANEKYLNLEALHNHSGTFQVDPKIYGQAVTVLTKVAKQARNLGLEPTTIDLGGGYPSGNQLKPDFDVVGGSNAKERPLARFSEEIMGKVAKAKKVLGKRPRVIFEPGRSVVDATMQLACSVVAVKDIPDRGPAAVVDAGVNIIPTAYWYDHDIKVIDDTPEGDLRPVSLFGPLCMQIDVLRDRILLPPLDVGSQLVVSNVGAYCITQSMQFIQPRPAAVMLGANGPELIRRAETWEHVFDLDVVPKGLS